MARAECKLLRGLGKAGIVAGQFLDVAQCGAQSGFGRAAAFVKLIERAHRGGVELFGVGQNTFLGLQCIVFAGQQMGSGNLFALIAPQIDHAQTVLLALQKIVEPAADALPSGMGLGDGVVRDAAEAIEQNALLRLIEAAGGFALRVDEGQLRGKLAQDGNGSGLVVDEDASLAVGEDFAAQDNLGAV